MELELEKTYLAKYLPEGSLEGKSKEIMDLYIPKNSPHSKLRIRKNGDTLEMTKKIPLNGDVSSQQEFTIPLSSEEFEVLSWLEGKRIRKIRYYYVFEWHQAEIDVFQDELEWLVLVDFEFSSEEEKQAFRMPDFCLVDITEEEFIAGWMLCGKKYSDIEDELKTFGYEKML